MLCALQVYLVALLFSRLLAGTFTTTTTGISVIYVYEYILP